MNRIMTITRIVGRSTNMADSQTTFVTTSTDISANSRPRQVQKNIITRRKYNYTNSGVVTQVVGCSTCLKLKQGKSSRKSRLRNYIVTQLNVCNIHVHVIKEEGEHFLTCRHQN